MKKIIALAIAVLLMAGGAQTPAAPDQAAQTPPEISNLPIKVVTTIFPQDNSVNLTTLLSPSAESHSHEDESVCFVYVHG